jgi:hypothetical protein
LILSWLINLFERNEEPKISHTSSIKSIKITSITALRSAIAELNTEGIQCSLVEGGTPRAYFTNQAGMGKADFVIALPTCRFDVGLYKGEDNTYEARTDWFGGSVEGLLGAPASTPEAREQAKLGKLLQRYGLCASQEVAKKKGLMTRRVVKENGSIALVCTGPGL